MNDQIIEGETGGACSMRGEVRNAWNILIGEHKWKVLFGINEG